MIEEIKKLQEKVDFYERILKESSALIFLNSSKNKMIWCNQRYTDLFGHTVDDVNEMGIMNYVQQYFHPDDLEVYVNSIKHMSEKDLEQSLSIYRQMDKDGNWRKILVSGKVLEWDGDIPAEGLSCAIDVTDKFAEFTKFEELLKENIYLKNKLKLKELTKRELEILKLIVKGKSTKEIADTEHISFHTVEWHRKNISKKLQLFKISDLVRFAVECGL